MEAARRPPREQPGSGKILIFVVAYEAERHIVSVFERIPEEIFSDPAVHILCIDDASKDRSAELLMQWVRRNDHEDRITVLRNPVNQGYGGNQKLGYRMTVNRGYDLVILLHGDGQYAPELLPDIVSTWRNGNADVILGSRMLEPGGARKGGMPFHKRVGNRFLTAFQNRLIGENLSEYHTGYRAYTRQFLNSIPFEMNTNDFHFDTEILLQAAHIGARIVEIPIPTRYGDEECHVPTLRYARDVVLSTIRFRLHQMGMLCSLKLRHLRPLRYQDKTTIPYSSHAMALEEVRLAGPGRVLDLGSGPGFVAAKCAEDGIGVTAVDREPPLPGIDLEFFPADLDRDRLPVDPGDFDCVLLLDLIEHLRDPEGFMVSLRHRMERPYPRTGEPFLVVLSTPNVAFIAVRLNLLMGRFPYAERGILDITHTRLFTRSSLVTLLDDCGYQIEKVRPVPVPFETVVGGPLGRFLGYLAAAGARVWPTMFAFQFLVTCRPNPSVAQVLASAEPPTA
ncbi:MAG: bifunctional glycosyltransferase/class I SAM-dependent methyltransferase [Acidobacteria bacterium]|nr:bifunctional glycosyltransferase/class I SAM-dependent methyltransferase [Acidobacteriota bacterium]